MLSHKFGPVDLPSTSPTGLLPTPQIETSPGRWDWRWWWTAVAPWEIPRDDTPSNIKCGSEAFKKLGDLRVLEIFGFFHKQTAVKVPRVWVKMIKSQNAWLDKLDTENYNCWSLLGTLVLKIWGWCSYCLSCAARSGDLCSTEFVRNPKPDMLDHLWLMVSILTLIYVTWSHGFCHSTYIYIYIHIHTLHYITLHYITLHYIYITLHTIHYITLHYITLHYIYITLHIIHYITLHYISYITLHYMTLHYITLHLHYITYHTLHYITLRYVTLHYITLHCITLYTYIQYNTIQYNT